MHRDDLGNRTSAGARSRRAGRRLMLAAPLWFAAGWKPVRAAEPAARRAGSRRLVRRDPLVATFSIVACDLDARQWGVAVQSRVLAVGSLVPFAEAEVGAIATQAWCNTQYGPEGLKLLRDGLSAREVVDKLTAADDGRDERQLAVVDAQGGVAHFTGSQCLDWAGAKEGDGYSCQGNILTGPEVAEAMARGFEETRGTLADRLVASLTAGQEAGGDKRGQQSAALLVCQRDRGYGGLNDRMIDLRVDDHEKPIAELRRLLDMSRRN